MKIKKILILLLIIASVSYAKVEKINDEFDGTYYYQTKSLDIYDGLKVPRPEVRFRTTKVKEKHSLIMELNVLSSALMSVNDKNKVRIKCNNGSIVTLNYEDTISSKGNGFGYFGNAVEGLRTWNKLTDTDIEALLSGVNMIRIEIKDTFTNINVDKKTSNKLIKLLNEIIKELEAEDKK